MIFTNNTLEIINENDKKVLELSNLYSSLVALDIEEGFNDKITFVQGNTTHRLLTLNTDKEIVLENKKDDELYLIIDLFDYKHFKVDSSIEQLILPGTEVSFEIIDEVTLNNRTGKCNWCIDILKKIGSGVAVLKLTYTSNRVAFLIVEDSLAFITSFRGLVKYAAEHNINLNFNELETRKI